MITPLNRSIVIVTEKLGKCYSISHSEQNGYRYTTLRDVISNKVKGLFRGRTPLSDNEHKMETFWAIKNVSFEISRGDIVGIIGRNGSGKSTLLKVLSRITEPSQGRVHIKGRIASLLEVGTGFHPELTGRENIFLNGAILGMSRVEIRRKFDEIVCFAEVEKFLDTPVKRYSSGMYVRLAFAVAAHLEPEILVVDEVLAVGDAQFQKKCLGKMQDVSSKEGRTVLFVSHNMAAVQTLCNKAIYLEKGEVKATGPANSLISQYQSNIYEVGKKRQSEAIELGSHLKLTHIDFTPHPIKSGNAMRFEFNFLAEKQIRLFELTAIIYCPQGTRIAILDFRRCGLPILLPAASPWRIEGEIKSVSLVEGDYPIDLYLNTDILPYHTVRNFTCLVVLPFDQDYTPYPPIHRGSLEFEYTANFQTSSS